MLRFIVLFLASLWILPRLLRLLSRSRRDLRGSRDKLGRHGRSVRKDDHARSMNPDKSGDPLQDLTQQDISDAEFEEIPPEE